jgi:acyl-CoA thioester hydrolase
MVKILPHSGVIEDNIHYLPIRVYYEDTDAGNVVYHSNYIKYMERGRTEFFRILGINQGDMQKMEDPEDRLFMVKKIEVDYQSPSRMDDCLVVKTSVIKVGGASVIFEQDIMKNDEILAKGLVIIVAVNHSNKPSRITGDLRKILEDTLISR